MWPSLAAPPTQDKRITPGLERIRYLVRSWPVDLRRFRAVLIGGTNGKGSTAAFLHAILSHLGMRVGLYTSPHLQQVHERIRLPEGLISDPYLRRLWHRVQDLARSYATTEPNRPAPSFFECLTACALKAFEEANLDLAILEVGLGGRWDATNVVEPEISVITNIDYDHEEYLGHDLGSIAREKFGITRPGHWLVCGEPRPEVRENMRRWAQEEHVRWWHPEDCGPAWTAMHARGNYRLAVDDGRFFVPPVMLGLTGAHQVRNALLAVITARLICERRDWPWNPAKVARGLQSTRWPGRLEWMTAENAVPVLLDGAHNPAGIRALCRYLDDLNPAPPLHMVFGCLDDKPWDEMLQLLRPRAHRLFLVPVPGTDRSWSNRDRAAAAIRFHGTPKVLSELNWERDDGAHWRLITGSLYLVGHARSFLLQRGYRTTRGPLRHNGKTTIITLEKTHE